MGSTDRPEKLYRLHPNNNLFEATPADLLAVVRRGVESGTIKGEVVEASYDDDWLADHSYLLPVAKGGIYVVIGPINGGEDR